MQKFKTAKGSKEAKKKSARRDRFRELPGDTVITVKGIEMRFNPDSLRFVGYDKAASITRETVHVINNGPVHVSGVKVKLTYRDLSGHMLHSREITLWTDVPAGETRKVDFTTWDPQNSFHYYKSAKPRKESTPYTITLKPLSWLVPREDTD